MEFDGVTSASKLFHVRAAETGNARSSTRDIQYGGRRWPQALSTANLCDRLKRVGQVGRSNPRTHWYTMTSVTVCEPPSCDMGNKVKVKSDFCIAYCYETITFQYAIVTDRAGG